MLDVTIQLEGLAVPSGGVLPIPKARKAIILEVK